MKILEAHNKVAEKTEIYVPYNILPLDPDSSNQAIMKYPEVGFWISSAMFFKYRLFTLIVNFQIRASVSALRNTRGLPWPKGQKKKVDEDILDWLQVMFGFQVTDLLLSIVACHMIHDGNMFHLILLNCRKIMWRIKGNI